MGNRASEVRTRQPKAGGLSTNTKPRGRRALPAPAHSPVNTGRFPATTTVPVNVRRASVSALTAGLLVAGLGASHATSASKEHKQVETVGIPTATPELDEMTLASASITAEPVKLEAEKVAVETQAAPAPAPVIEKASAPAPAPVVQAPAPQAVQPIKAAAPAPVQAPAPAPVSAAPSGRAEMIVNAALSQVGQGQDCTRLVTRSLAAVGINFHGWPAEYYSLGYAVSAAEAQAGDLIFYANGGGGMAHIAIYIGNGEAVHGGYNGGQTVRWKANVPAPATGAQYIRLR